MDIISPMPRKSPEHALHAFKGTGRMKSSPRPKSIALTAPNVSLDDIANAVGFSVTEMPRARAAYLVALLAHGTHRKALISARMTVGEWMAVKNDKPFQEAIALVRTAWDETRTVNVDDEIYRRAMAGKKDEASAKLLMFHAERRDGRYLSPQARVAMRLGNQSGSVINIAVVLPSGEVITPKAVQDLHQTDTEEGASAEYPYKTRGFLQRIMGYEPTPTENAEKIGGVDSGCGHGTAGADGVGAGDGRDGDE